MKYLLILTLALSMCVSNAMEKTSGSNAQEKYTRVLGTGKTEEEAKLNGFRTAIQIVVGSVVVSEKEAKNNFLTRDEVMNYSAGYVDDYKIIDSTVTSSGYTLVMDVLVKSSKIAEQILNRSKSDAVLEGPKLANQYKSYLQERRSGDQLINQFLSKYPENVLNIKVGKPEFKVDSYRNSILIITYEIGLNYKWLESLREIYSIMADGDRHSPFKRRVTIKKPNEWFGDTTEYYFNDKVRLDKIDDVISGGGMVKQLKIVDKNNLILHSSCSAPPSFDSGDTLRGQDVFEYIKELKISEDSPMYKNLDKMDRIEVNIIPLTYHGTPQFEKECHTN